VVTARPVCCPVVTARTVLTVIIPCNVLRGLEL